MGTMSNGPLPTTLTFLSSLPTSPTGSKVRFLGCVTHYTLSNATLSLQHSYPASQAGTVVALVDASLLLEGLKRENTQVGAWVNIIGYVEGVYGKREEVKKKSKSGGEGIATGSDMEPVKVRIKAVVMWSAGSLKLGAYEAALEERLRL